MFPSRLVAALAAGITLAAAAPAAAHPHVWIDLRTVALLDAEGRLEGVRVEWLLDRFYSAVAEEDMDTDRDKAVSPAEAQLWAETAFGNIASVGYFAEFLIDGRSYQPTRASDPVGRWVDGQVFMSFVIRPDAPADPRKVAVGYMVYDPQYYIDVRHPDGPGFAAVEGPGQAACTATVGRSEPAPEVVASAAALDKDETAPSGLGRLFADYVKVTCR
ncbi:hypothetical protein GCM10017083_42020 [Thalassobaculum fulvum]|uniref:DUF1007 family protein n=1 Tax=Thalassobaculum fulvum TaxID=1633335 RepID=A0A919CRD2_9PROT|nr:DUF1007 family protein [Thalassobaculum fulvum]GHD58687.1 hypothetical protein GCM10017083_42020 [Thalassobaculum fulvum]